MRILPSNPVERRAAQAILRHALLRWETQAGIFVAVAVLVVLPDAWKLHRRPGPGLRGLEPWLEPEQRVRQRRGRPAGTAGGGRAGGAHHPGLPRAPGRRPGERPAASASCCWASRMGRSRPRRRCRCRDIDGWIRSMFTFARSAEALRRQGAFAEDLRTLPEEIRALEWQLGRGGQDTAVLKETIEKKRQTLAALTDVNRSLQRSEDELRDASRRHREHPRAAPAHDHGPPAARAGHRQAVRRRGGSRRLHEGHGRFPGRRAAGLPRRVPN